MTRKFNFAFDRLQIGSSIKYKNTLFGNYLLKCNSQNDFIILQLFFEYIMVHPYGSFFFNTCINVGSWPSSGKNEY